MIISVTGASYLFALILIVPMWFNVWPGELGFYTINFGRRLQLKN
jgi:hypothetical protein